MAVSSFTEVEKAIELYESGMTQTEVAERLGVTQKVIWNAFRKKGYVCRIAKPRDQFRENNANWRGSDVGYHAWWHRNRNARLQSEKRAVQVFVLVALLATLFFLII